MVVCIGEQQKQGWVDSDDTAYCCWLTKLNSIYKGKKKKKQCNEQTEHLS